MGHMLRLVAPGAAEILGEPKDVRDRLFHGLGAPNAQRDFAREVAPDLLLALARALLTVAAGASDVGNWEAALPRDYESRPDARHDIELEGTPVLRRPWLGEWIEVSRELAERSSLVDPDTGQYVVRYQVQVTGAKGPRRRRRDR